MNIHYTRAAVIGRLHATTGASQLSARAASQRQLSQFVRRRRRAESLVAGAEPVQLVDNGVTWARVVSWSRTRIHSAK